MVRFKWTAIVAVGHDHDDLLEKVATSCASTTVPCAMPTPLTAAPARLYTPASFTPPSWVLPRAALRSTVLPDCATPEAEVVAAKGPMAAVATAFELGV